MSNNIRLALIGSVAASLSIGGFCAAQTPEQEAQWKAEREASLAAAKQRAAELERERAARKADPMAWERSLDPMSAGGWEFRAVGGDGSWATFSTTHQLKRSGKGVTAWLREEYAEPPMSSEGHYSSMVKKVQYDCAKQQARVLVMVFYSENNLAGNQRTEEEDAKTAPWTAIVPGTRDELEFLWACNAAK